MSGGSTRVDCLIGSTGFVGGTLARQHDFPARVNSSTIAGIDGQAFDTVVCAAAPGSMVEANTDPERDLQKIGALTTRLSQIGARRFILISSIAVLRDFAGGDDEGTTRFQETLAYGRHRRMLEAFCEDRFDNCLVVRLPALFGAGLRKNFVFDLLNPVPTMLTEAKIDDLCAGLEAPLAARVRALYRPDPATKMLRIDRAGLDADPQRAGLEQAVIALGAAATRFHNPGTTYQYYDLTRLWSDIEVAAANGLRHVHLAPEPLEAARIHHRLTGHPMPETGARLHREDMRTRHGALWGRSGPYLDDADAVLDRLAAFYRAGTLAA